MEKRNNIKVNVVLILVCVEVSVGGENTVFVDDKMKVLILVCVEVSVGVTTSKADERKLKAS